jgi:hypothetical protein
MLSGQVFVRRVACGSFAWGRATCQRRQRFRGSLFLESLAYLFYYSTQCSFAVAALLPLRLSDLDTVGRLTCHFPSSFRVPAIYVMYSWAADLPYMSMVLSGGLS